ncbi:NnrU family protein [Halomonas vilamensis]|uniref:NnrU family protein n=1 Tax=Vreelandella vilamensis TaxID=531309 RepID=A0ABU1H614_9GAMM|nr:NnrU family protein [Halomonas vilamensis]MDR5899749.1 NnrU family protein [Halomonas vilamensis]
MSGSIRSYVYPAFAITTHHKEKEDLLINGRLGDIVFFGAFLVWAIFDFRDARRRPQQTPQTPRMTSTLATVVIGLVAYYLFAFHLHVWVTGVPVM